MIFDFDISVPVLILLTLTLLLALLSSIVGLRYIRKVARAGHRIDAEEDAPSDVPGLSVIVYAHNAENHIGKFLTELLAQDHPDFEVIVVNDASEDNTHEIVDNMLEENPRLYLTFVSDSAQNISHRKLAYTVGLRAAKKPVALITSSNVDIPDSSWLRRMAAPFADNDIEVGIGTAYVDRDTDHGTGKYWRSFDQLVSDTRWIGAALCDKPYRGTAFNLAFRTDTFFRNKGYVSTNRFQAGEDDLFVNEVSTPDNTAIIFHPKAMIRICYPEKDYPRLWKRHKERYTFTSRYLHTGGLRVQGFMSLCLWGSSGCALAAAIAGLPNLMPACAALLISLLTWADQICVYRRAATAMRSIRLWWSVPFLWLARPLLNACYRVGFQANKHSNYTWQQPH